MDYLVLIKLDFLYMSHYCRPYQFGYIRGQFFQRRLHSFRHEGPIRIDDELSITYTAASHFKIFCETILTDPVMQRREKMFKFNQAIRQTTQVRGSDYLGGTEDPKLL